MTLTVLCAAQAAGVLTDPRVAEREDRGRFSSTLAIGLTDRLSHPETARRIERGEPLAGVGELLSAMVSQNESVRSAAIVDAGGEPLAVVGSHLLLWNDEAAIATGDGNATQVYVPIYRGMEEFGQVQLVFKPLVPTRWGIAVPPLLRAFLFIAAGGFIVHLLFLRRMLRYLDPSQAVPARVRTTLDTLAEGLVLLDEQGQVVLANAALAGVLGISSDELKGHDLGDLAWHEDGVFIPADELPWQRAMASGTAVVGRTLQLTVCEGGLRQQLAGVSGDSSASTADGAASHEATPEPTTRRVVSFLVNATPIASEQDQSKQGSLVSFDDITNLEEKKVQLAETLEAVRESSEEIRRQNAELERLATHDVLTGCVNRRRLFQELEAHWNGAGRHGYPVSCVLADVDHFKSVNDTHGHSTGDEVLARVGAVLRETARETDLVARYGGEEFCVLLPHTSLREATTAAERFRSAIASLEFAELSVTASFGVTAVGHGAADPQELIDQADRCLYEAKRTGRNRVVEVGDVDLSQPMSPEEGERPVRAVPSATPKIPFQAVTALISALAYRDRRTAEHCRRVADLAVATAEGLLSLSDCYSLEIAALLHDLGKIGVPDHILLKAGPLTADEWDVMRRHDRIGVEIVRASFACPSLTRVLRQAKMHFGDAPTLTIAARILSVADAFDSMVTDQPYRPGRTRDEAFAELRRCATGEIGQFDPEIVERFIAAVRFNRSGPAIPVETETALSIGMQIEHLAAALDDQDLDRLAAMAERVQQVAERAGVHAVAEQAERLSHTVGDQRGDLFTVLQQAGDLLSLCRSTQATYIETDAVPALPAARVVEADAVGTIE